MSPTPRHKRLSRKDRLHAAQYWIPKYTGKNLIRGYRKHFGVDLLCAITELEMLGHHVDAKYKANIIKLQEHKEKLAEERKMLKELERYREKFPDSNEYFYFIAGYTPAGFAYGITWEEYYREFYDGACDQGNVPIDESPCNIDNDTDIPF